MFNFARSKMTEHGLRLEDVAPQMNIAVSSLSNKLNGKSEFSLDEAIAFKRIVKSDLPLEELFKESNEEAE